MLYSSTATLQSCSICSNTVTGNVVSEQDSHLSLPPSVSWREVLLTCLPPLLGRNTYAMGLPH